MGLSIDIDPGYINNTSVMNNNIRTINFTL